MALAPGESKGMNDAMRSDPAPRALAPIALALALVAVGFGACSDCGDDVHDAVDTADTHGADSVVDSGPDATDTRDDAETELPDAPDTIDEAWRVDGRLVPPVGAPAADAGWVALNRFGRRAVVDGTFTLDVAKDGLTLTLLLPPGTPTDATPSPLLVATISRPEDDAPEAVTVDASSTALALLFMDPRATSPDPERLMAMRSVATGSPRLAMLATEIGTGWGERAWTTAPSVLSRFDAALDAVLAAVSPLEDPFARTPTGTVGLDLLSRAGPDLVQVQRDPSGVLKVSARPLVPGVVKVTATRATAMPGARDTWLGVPVEVLADRALLATANLTNRGASEASVSVPNDALVAIEATAEASPENLRAAAAELVTALAPGLSCPMPSEPAALPSDLVGLDCTLPTGVATEAGRRLVGLARPLVARAAARESEAPGRTLDPSAAWGTLGTARHQQLLVAVGDPFTPRVIVSAPALVDPGDSVEVRGEAFDLPGRDLAPDTRVTFVDAFGHARAATSETTLAATGSMRAGRKLVVPPGLAGDLEVRVESPAGRFEAAGPRVRPRIVRFTPSVLRPSAGPHAIRVDGTGLTPALAFTLGGKAYSTPNATRSDTFTFDLDPATLGPGSHVASLASTGEPTLTVASLAVLDVPATSPRGATLVVKLRGLDPLVDTLAASAGDLSLPVRLLARDPADAPGVARALVDTSALPTAGHALRLSTPDAAVNIDLVVTAPAPPWTRTTSFHATDPGWRAVDFARALEIADGTLIPFGDFTFLDTSVLVSGGWYCPLKITPADQVVPATCNHFTRVCNDAWLWDTVTDDARWLLTTRPPGRASSGVHCDPKVVAGPSSWSGVPKRDIADLVLSYDTVALGGATLRGPAAKLSLPFAKGGGLAIRPPTGGGRSEVSLDLDIADATSNADYPVVLLSGVTGVRIERLVINGRVGGCRTALRIEGSHDIQIDELLVRNCDLALDISGSSDVRIGTPRPLGSGSRGAGAVTVLGAKTAVSIVGSEDVVAVVRIGAFTDVDFPDAIEVGASGTDGVVIHDSRQVRVSGEIGRTVGDAVRVSGASSGVLLGPLELGFVRRPMTAARPEGLPTWAAGASNLAVGTGIRVVGASDVRVVDTTIMQAGDGVRVEGGGLVLRRVALGGIDDGVGAGPLAALPPANARGLVATGVVQLDAEDLVVGRNAEVGVDLVDASGRLRVARLVTASRGAGLIAGGQRCGVRATRTRDLVLEATTFTGDVVGLCLVDVSDLVVDGLDAIDVALGIDGSGVERALLRALSVLGRAGVRLANASAVDLEDATLVAGKPATTGPSGLDGLAGLEDEALRLAGTGPSTDPIGVARLDATASTAVAIRLVDLGTATSFRATHATADETAFAISGAAGAPVHAVDLTLDGPSEDTKAPRLRLAGASRLSLDGAEVHGSIFIEDAPGGLDMRQGAADSIGLTGHTRIVLDGVQAAVEGLSLSAPRVAVRAHTGPVRIGACVVDAGVEPLEPSAIAVDGLGGKLTVGACDGWIQIANAHDAASTATLQGVLGAEIASVAGPLALIGGAGHRVAGVASVSLEAGASGVRLVDAEPTSKDGLSRARGSLATFVPAGASASIQVMRVTAPDHALVEVFDAAGVALARGFALGGTARLVLAPTEAPSVRVTSADGQSGPRESLVAPSPECIPTTN
ncbi:MAG: hypothetical protein JNJ59_21970, partial [Deltaproteobacteria bacterium]|nr:hypothetical protein [Deltaproteobacteria bacterium]